MTFTSQRGPTETGSDCTLADEAGCARGGLTRLFIACCSTGQHPKQTDDTNPRPHHHPRSTPMPAEKIEIRNVNVPDRTERVDRTKYEAMRAALMAVLPDEAPGLKVVDAKAALLPLLPDELFPQGDKAGWWLKAVQLDLEARGVIRRAPSSPVQLRPGRNRSPVVGAGRRRRSREHVRLAHRPLGSVMADRARNSADIARSERPRGCHPRPARDDEDAEDRCRRP